MTIRDKTGYDCLNSNPIEFAKELSIPSLFLVAEKDSVALPKKVYKMFNLYGSDKKKLHIMKSREHADERTDDDYIVGVNYLNALYELSQIEQS